MPISHVGQPPDLQTGHCGGKFDLRVRKHKPAIVVSLRGLYFNASKCPLCSFQCKIERMGGINFCFPSEAGDTPALKKAL